MLMKRQGSMATILLVLYSDVMETWDKGMKVFSRCRNQQLTAFLTKKHQIRFSEPKEEGAGTRIAEKLNSSRCIVRDELKP